MKIIHLIFLICFIIVLSIPLLFLALDVQISPVNLNENRKLASFPKLPTSNQNIEKYINDNIAFRTNIISMYQYLFGWHLYSPISPYIRGKDNHIFNKNEILNQLGLVDYNDFQYNEVISGMNYIANYYNTPFAFILTPDKSSVLLNYIPDWAVKFKNNHSTLSQRETLLKKISKTDNFKFVDLYDYFIQTPEEYFNKRYDIYHWNGYALDKALKVILEISKFNNVDIDNTTNYYTKSEKKYRVFPYYGNNAYEQVELLYINDNISNLEYIKENKLTNYNQNNPDRIINYNRNQYRFLIFSDSSFKSKFISSFVKKLNTNDDLLPIVHTVHDYIHLFNKDYVSYHVYRKYLMEKPNIVFFQITERTLNPKTFPNDNIFNIVGRYALGKNEHFIFPEYLTNNPNNHITNVEKKISDDSFINVAKEFKTDSKGEIYISFRYIAPKKTTAILEYSYDKDFINPTLLTVDIGGKNDSISFHIKSEPNKIIYIRIKPGKVKGTYNFLDIPELREKM